MGDSLSHLDDLLVQLIDNVTPCVGVCASRTVLIRLAMYGAGFCSGS